MIFDARVTIHQRQHNHPDYKVVHDAMRSIKFFQRIVADGKLFSTLPGMYRLIDFNAAIDDVQRQIERVLSPLGFEFSIELAQVSEERVYNLKPAPPFADLFGALAGIRPTGYEALAALTAPDKARDSDYHFFASLFSK